MCASLATMTRCGRALGKLFRVFICNGRSNRLKSAVDSTLTWICRSHPSGLTFQLGDASPAFMIATSIRPPLSTYARARDANSWTLANLSMSICHTSTVPFLPVLDSMSALAPSPFSTERTPRMTLAAPRFSAWRAASRPRPVFAPVTNTCWSLQEPGGGRVGVLKGWQKSLSIIAV